MPWKAGGHIGGLLNADGLLVRWHTLSMLRYLGLGEATRRFILPPGGGGGGVAWAIPMLLHLSLQKSISTCNTWQARDGAKIGRAYCYR